MNKVKHASKWPYLFVALALAGLIFVGFTRAARRTTKKTETTAVATPIHDLESPAPLEPTPIVSQTGQFKLPADKKIPILMYHYIRDFNNPSDKIGTNLSVSRATFAKQLADIKHAGFTTITFNDLSQPLPEKPIILTFDDGYDDAYGDALPSLQKEGMHGVFYLVTGFLNKPGYLNDEQVKALDAAGMEIGAHTIDHHDLSKATYAQQQKELTESRSVLEKILGKQVVDFCYPSGKYNADTLTLDQSVGYRTATTTHPGIAEGRDFNERPFELKRVRIENDTDVVKAISK